MARNTKVGIDYFSHDVDILQDKKIKIIKAKHGLIGYAVYLRLLEELYRDNGYYLKIDEDFNILFSDDNNLDYNAYILILNDCIEKELFDNNKYKKHNILTSERIQNNYCTATDRRKSVTFIKEYLLIDPKTIYKDVVNVYIENLNVNINRLNENIGTQTKIKESKSNKNKLNNYYPCSELPYFNDPLFQETWLAWIDVRNKKKAINSEYSMKKISNQLTKWANGNIDIAIAIIDKSILGNYPNIYEPNKPFNPKAVNTKWQGEQNFDF